MKRSVYESAYDSRYQCLRVEVRTCASTRATGDKVRTTYA